MPASHQLGLDLAQLRPQPLRLGDARELKASVLGLPADMREAQKPERLRLAESPRLPSLGREPAELDQARLLGGQLQAELRKPAAKLGEEPLGVITMLEADDVVVGETHDDHIAVRIPPPPLVGPQVEDVMEIDVCEQRRNRCLLRRSLRRLRPLPVLDHSRLQPLTDQTHDAPVRDPVLEEPPQPPVVDGVVEATDVRIQHPAHLPPQDPGRERIQRLMRAAPRPKPVREAEKVRLEDGVQDLDDGTLEGACPPMRQRPTVAAARPPSGCTPSATVSP